jgi:hypothetical protein
MELGFLHEWKDHHTAHVNKTLAVRIIIIIISVSIGLDYRLDDRDSRVRFPARAGSFSLHHRVQTGSGAHPASYPMGTRGSFPGGKAAGA